MTIPAHAEVNEELVSTLRHALELLERSSINSVPAPREPEPQDLGTTLRQVLAAEAVYPPLESDVLSGAEPEVRARVLAKFEALRLDVLSQVDQIPVEEELHWTAALTYMELKAQWLQRQVRVCYEQMLTGSCNQEVALEASAVSYLLGLLEPHLDQVHLARIQDLFVSQAVD
jgi:hypothetical protein